MGEGVQPPPIGQSAVAAAGRKTTGRIRLGSMKRCTRFGFSKEDFLVHRCRVRLQIVFTVAGKAVAEITRGREHRKTNWRSTARCATKSTVASK